MQKIAVYRDAFYEQLLRKLKGPHAERLRAEAVAMRQPFGGARQHFNHYLARRRALQLQHVHLAQLFAAIGYTEAAARQAAVVPVASARMTCEMRCRMAAAHLAVERGDLAAAASQLPPIEDLLRRAIECGAMVDPWNILGFGGQYSLFPAVENSVYDHRIDELLDMMSDIFMLYVRIHKAAAAAGDLGLQQALSRSLAELARWWDQFASLEVGSIEGISGQATLESAESVAAALRAWHEGGAAAGDLAFWRRQRRTFPLAQSLRPGDRHVVGPPRSRWPPWPCWCNGSARPRRSRWSRRTTPSTIWRCCGWKIFGATDQLRANDSPSGRSLQRPVASSPAAETPVCHQPASWPLARKFLDYLEANAEEYWQVPHFDMAAEALGNGGGADEGIGRRVRRRRFDDELGGESRTTRTTCSARPTRTSPTATAPTTASRARFSRPAKAPPISSWSARPSGSSAG